MPELPEVETVRRTLEPHLVGRRVVTLDLHRADIVTGSTRRQDLLHRCTVTSLDRRGKQLALIAVPDARGARGKTSPASRALVVHLGMTGQLLFLAPEAQPTQTDHIHAQWTLADKRDRIAGTLIFRDPRRFGGLFPYRSRESLELAWSTLGPDALEPRTHDHPSLETLWRSRRAIKAALLDQSCIAGIGNIYADEALFRARVHPARPARSLSKEEGTGLLAAVREVMHAALEQGGSTLRDYRSGVGKTGGFQARHLVYGRRGKPCTRCGGKLSSTTLGQRTTVWCPACQPRRPKKG